MTRIVLDSSAVDQLGALHELAEVCDASGRIVGYFRPATDPSLYRRVKVPFTDAELTRFEEEPGGRSLDEIMRDLRGRT